MTRHILKQLSDIRKEIRDLGQAAGRVEREIEALKGREDNQKSEYLQKRKELMEKKRVELLRLENEAEEYIQSIEDSCLCRIIRYKYLYDLSWQQVAARMGHKYSAESCRKKVERFMGDRTGQ